ncbi:MAG: DEAD/DEAH box helicase family protein [Bacteroidales bacterium]|nr:DEAD/DEAH box helicase family protein [Bacteroidales bacterium]MCF8338130.1 DEAD/DEAH box helicase family protein [Bacteroidales bacterium]
MKNNKPFEIKLPSERWAPGQEQMEEADNDYRKLLPPLVHKIRTTVEQWRNDGYPDVTPTTKTLLDYWFNSEHRIGERPFQFFYAQRESIESIIYLYEVFKARDKFDLMRFDSSGLLSSGYFDETWPRYVIKMATGTGKTKVLGLALVWSYFNALYENKEDFSKNFLVIAPNIIVLNRIRKDFDGFKMFFDEPFFPDDGYNDKNWRTDFQLTLHIQDELKPISDNGNIFLTNIHRVFMPEDREPTMEEQFLGQKPKNDADTARMMDLGKVLRSDKIKDLIVLNDEAHHIHDKKMAWFQAIEDINNKLKLKTGHGIRFQLDNTATPKHNDGKIFVQTTADYPLVEAIRDNVVKSPVLPDAESRSKIEEKDSSDFVERYRDFIHLGYIEWKKQYEEQKNHKTPILFIMTMNTYEANKAAEFLDESYPEMKDAVLTIHTNRSGELHEMSKSKGKQKELDKLREAADLIDATDSPYKAVCSVLMLREGWDVRNVSSIVGLRPFNAESKILPEQAIGRGLRKMYPLEVDEKLTVIGTPAFIDFVESLKTEGVEFQYSSMGEGTKQSNPLVIQVDWDNEAKNLDELDIPLPVLMPRIYREYKKLDEIQPENIGHEIAELKQFDENELKEIVFRDIDDKESHRTVFTNNNPDYRNVLKYYTQSILRDNRMIGGFDLLYPKVEAFIIHNLFGQELDLADMQVLRNLFEPYPRKILFDTFRQAINEVTISEQQPAKIQEHISLKDTKPKVVSNQRFIKPGKSVFNKVIGDNEFELEVAAFLENQCEDIVSFSKNTMGDGGINFKMEYQAQNGNIREYFPDFFVKQDEETVYIVETKGREDTNDLNKIKRLKTWCEDVNNIQEEIKYYPLYIKQEEWEEYNQKLKSFSDMLSVFLK